MPGSSGYFETAANEVSELPDFLADYPAWIKRQDCASHRHAPARPGRLVACLNPFF